MTRHPALSDTAQDGMNEDTTKAWIEIFSVTPQLVRDVVAEVVREGATTLTENFYTRMMAHPRAATYLDQERVQKRLRATLCAWMTDLFGTLDAQQIPEAIERQLQVGVVHARIRLPLDLMSAGIRILKRGIRRRIDFTALDAADRLIAHTYVSDLLHLVDGLMNQAYFRDIQAVARADEAYRQFSSKRSIALERNHQRAALSEWAEALLMAAWRQGAPLPTLRDSEFGVWLHHKGRVVFEHADELQSIQAAVDAMDAQLLPRLREAGDDRARIDNTLAAIKQLLDLIRLKLQSLFETVMAHDEGLDPETQLPDRRHLPATLMREMQAHQQSGRPFCLLLIDLQFPRLKGVQHAGALNRLLRAAIQAVSECVRTSDQLFRFDEHRLMLLAVECSRAKAAEMGASLSEHLRHAIQTGNVQGSWTPVSPSIHIGVAEFDQHPDYLYFIQRVETALAEAMSDRRSRNALA